MKNAKNIRRQRKSFIEKRGILFSCIILFISSIQFTEAQTPQKNLEKYWFYRQRLQEHFIYHNRNPMTAGTNQPAGGVFVSQTPEGIKTTADWGDGVWWLGHYIGMLAMEYKLLKDNHQPYETTLLDLKNALIAFKRLDENAEPYFGGQGSVNGFYLRDDVPNDSLVREQLKVNSITSSYSEHKGTMLENSPSHDQAWSMCVGLALVQKCVDNPEIVKISQDIAFLLISGMQFSKNGKPSGKKSWGVINPVSGINVSKKKGQNISSMKYAWGTVGTKLSGKDLHCTKSQNKMAKIVWNTMQNHLFFEFPSLGLKQRVFNWYGILCLSTVMNEWGNESSYNNLYDWLVYQGSKAATKRAETGFDEFFIHLPAIAEILHGDNKSHLLAPEKYEYYLNTAPSDAGHQYYLNGKKYLSEKPWHAASLFCPTDLDFHGEYNMLDYMLLYNAYFLVYHNHKKTTDSIIEYFNNKTDTTFKTTPEQSDFYTKTNHTILLYPKPNIYSIEFDNNRLYYHKINAAPYIGYWGDFEQRRVFIDTIGKTSIKPNTVSNMQVYYNSENEYIQIYQASNYQYIISDKTGKIVLTGAISDENNAHLNINNLHTGIYILNIYNNNFLLGTFEIIKD